MSALKSNRVRDVDALAADALHVPVADRLRDDDAAAAEPWRLERPVVMNDGRTAAHVVPDGAVSDRHHEDLRRTEIRRWASGIERDPPTRRRSFREC